MGTTRLPYTGDYLTFIRTENSEWQRVCRRLTLLKLYDNKLYIEKRKSANNSCRQYEAKQYRNVKQPTCIYIAYIN